jgi:hypothetical protein
MYYEKTYVPTWIYVVPSIPFKHVKQLLSEVMGNRVAGFSIIVFNKKLVTRNVVQTLISE